MEVFWMAVIIEAMAKANAIAVISKILLALMRSWRLENIIKYSGVRVQGEGFRVQDTRYNSL